MPKPQKKAGTQIPALKFFMTKDYTQPVGFGSPAILQAPLPGPDGNNS